jgi:cyclin C
LTLQGTFNLSQEESSLAWSIINDHYMTDLPLLYAPHIIAITSILLALILRPTGNVETPTVGASANTIATAAQAALNAASQPKTAPSPGKTGAPVRTKVQKLSNWLAESNVDIEGMIDCTQEIISFYDFQETYNEKITREQINRFVKARGLDR